jgi:translation initiation factor RLI1
MPKPRALLDYRKCHPEKCEKGICLAASACLNGVLSQKALHEMPDLSPAMCVGCGICAQACPFKAVRMT